MADRGSSDVMCGACGRTWVVEAPDPMPPRPAEDFFPVPQLQGTDLSRYLYSSCPDCGQEQLLDFGETGAIRSDGGWCPPHDTKAECASDDRPP